MGAFMLFTLPFLFFRLLGVRKCKACCRVLCAHVRLSNPTYSACLDLPMHLRLNTEVIFGLGCVFLFRIHPLTYMHTHKHAGHKHCQWDAFDKLNPFASPVISLVSRNEKALCVSGWSKHPHLRVQFSCTALARVVHWPSHSTDINNPCWVRGLQWPQTLSGIQAADTLRQYPALPS